MPLYLLLLFNLNLTFVMLQRFGHSCLECLFVFQFLLLQGQLDVLLFPHPLLGQLLVQLVNAPVGVCDQRIQVVRRQLPG